MAITTILELLNNPLFKFLGIVAVGLSLLGGAYTKGQYDGRQAVKASIERATQDAIKRGHSGAADALKKLDTNKIPDYWWRD